MRGTTPYRKIFSFRHSRMARKLRIGRTDGFYWVKWADPFGRPTVWRVGQYVEGIGWIMPGDTRTYYDSNFISINERKIPKNWVFGNPSRVRLYVLLIALIISLASCAIDIIVFINRIIK